MAARAEDHPTGTIPGLGPRSVPGAAKDKTTGAVGARRSMPDDPAVGRSAAIGAGVGFVSFLLIITIAGTMGGMGVGGAFGMALFAGAFGGTGLGLMLGAAVGLGLPSNKEHAVPSPRERRGRGQGAAPR